MDHSSATGAKPGSLRDLHLQLRYRTGSNDLVREFYVPCLQRSSQYLRAAGYFSSHGLGVAAQGVAHLLARGGRIKLIASPALSEEDEQAINRGLRSRDDVLQQAASRGFLDIAGSLIEDRLNALAWLLASGLMELRLALRTDSTGRLSRGLFHEKIGVFQDALGNRVAFTGSANETVGGLVENFESVDAYWSWDDGQGRVAQKVLDFNMLWDDLLPGVRVVDFTAVAKEILSRFRRAARPTKDPAEELPLPRLGEPRPASTPVLRDYQRRAVESWFAASTRGVLEMATGTGKTITALSACRRLISLQKVQAVVIVCPFKHLVTQWASEATKFGITPILAFESRAEWVQRLVPALVASQLGGQVLWVVATNATFAGQTFQAQLQDFPTNSVLVVDEVHNVGASHLRGCLPPQFKHRLGLSATPQRWFDAEGTAAITDYFGGILEPRLGIREAIALGALVPYLYYPIVVRLTHDEQQEYEEISRRLGQFLRGESPLEDNPAAGALLGQRARLLGTAAEKMPALRAIMTRHPGLSRFLVYCGDGSVETEENARIERQIGVVTRMLGAELGYRVATYTAETSTAERERLRNAIDDGSIQGLVAIRCLDEGVDIPSIRFAVLLASSRNPRQFIQRRGRVLRRAENKSEAVIYDTLVAPAPGASTSDTERQLMRAELARFAAFADDALNPGEARAAVLSLQQEYDCVDL